MRNVAIGFFGAALVVGMFALTIRAIVKTQEFEDGVRAERCARYGENIPKDLARYCADLGV